MKKKINKIPKYGWGTLSVKAWQGASLGDKIGTIGGQAANMFANATSGQPVTAGGVLSGIAGGAAAGASIGGPWGAVIGGALGGITSGIGTGGIVDENTGEITDPSGIAGLFGHSKGYLRRKSNIIKNSNISREFTEQLRAEEAMLTNNGLNAYLAALGSGSIPTTQYYGDNGEVAMTRDGQIYQFPDIPGVPTDSYLTEVPVTTGPDAFGNIKTDGGTVNSNSKKQLLRKEDVIALGLDPKKKYTPAEAEKKLLKPMSKGKDVYAQNTNKLNEKFNLDVHNTINTIQEMNKINKPKFKNGRQAAEEGENAIEYKTINGKTYKRIKKSANGIAKTDPTPYDEYAAGVDDAYRSLRNRKLKERLSKVFNNIGDYTALIPSLINMFDRKSERAQYFVSPAKYGPSTFNIEPQLRGINTNNAISRYNMANINPNTGANMAYGLQTAAQRDRAIADVYAQKNNVENQYAFQNAGIYNNWANKLDQARHTAYVEQSQNDAAARNIQRQGIGDFVSTLLNIERDKTASQMDKLKLAAITPLLKYGMENKTLDPILTTYNRLLG